MDTILTIVKLLGGLGLFIYGMKLMGDGLENAAGEGLKKILEKVIIVFFVLIVIFGNILLIYNFKNKFKSIIVIRRLIWRTLK